MKIRGFLILLLFFLVTVIPTQPLKAGGGDLFVSTDLTFLGYPIYLDAPEQEVGRFNFTVSLDDPVTITGITIEEACKYSSYRVASKAYLINNYGIIVGETNANSNSFTFSGSNLQFEIPSKATRNISLQIDTLNAPENQCSWKITSILAKDSITNQAVNFSKDAYDDLTRGKIWVSPKPNLVIDDIILKDPDTGYSAANNIQIGNYREVILKIKNNGGGTVYQPAAGNSIVSADISSWPADVMPNGGVSANNDIVKLLLNSGQSYEQQMPNIKFNKSGSYKLTYVVDYNNVIPEINEFDNSKSIDVAVGGVADLTVDSVTIIPESPKINETVKVTVKVKNVGSSDIISGTGLDTYNFNLYNLGFTQTGGSQQGNPTQSNPLKPGQTFLVEEAIGYFTSVGVKNLSFTINNAKELPETNYNNNTKAITFTVLDQSTTNTTQPEPEPEPESTIQPELEITQQPEQTPISVSPPVSTVNNQWFEQEKKSVTNVDSNLTNRLKGYILLQVQEHGEAWYVDEVSKEKYYLRDGSVAYEALRKFGLGITNSDLAKIPIGIESRFSDIDSDSDGLADKLEEGLGTNLNNPDSDGDGYNDGIEVKSGYNPLGSGKLAVDNSLTNRLKGRILLQVQSKGEAWYLNPKDNKRYYMKDGEAAYQIMRYLSLGITNNDLRKITVGDL